ncbi:MAG: nucleoside hydrolase, partial [Calditrichaeota bacterium]|nr:nucleoside hydrolase [Calditrichota bacterium]
ALALILSSPELELVGVTVATGQTRERARIVCKMLYETGREDVPVALGRQTPVPANSGKPPRYEPQFYWAKGFDAVKPVSTPAADFIIQKLRAQPGEIVLITIGPVTNIGDVLRKDPEALKQAKAVYAMFGSFYRGYGGASTPSREWNVACDVDAAKLFVASGVKVTYAGLDVTAHVTLDANNRLRLLMRQSPLTNALCGLYSLWGRETPILFDPVAVGMLLWPELFTFRDVHVTVTDDGFTVVDESKPPNAHIGTQIDDKRFIKRLMERYLHQNLGR